MVLAHHIGCRIYYQDTDSMHIAKDDLPKLADAFREKYNRELIGKGMGQFHNDFDGGDHAVESWFIAKKVYLDKLDTGAYHIRCKGVPKEGVLAANKNVEETYQKLFNGEEIEFDIAIGKPKFIFEKQFTVSTNHDFKRKVSACLPVGEF